MRRDSLRLARLLICPVQPACQCRPFFVVVHLALWWSHRNGFAFCFPSIFHSLFHHRKTTATGVLNGCIPVRSPIMSFSFVSLASENGTLSACLVVPSNFPAGVKEGEKEEAEQNGVDSLWPEMNNRGSHGARARAKV